MKIRDYLTEGIDSKTRRQLLMSIDQMPKGKTKISGIEVKGDGKSVSFTFPQDDIEITSALVNIVDSIPSRSFDYKNKGDKIVFTVKGM